MTPPYIVGAIGSLKLVPVTFTVMVYDPRNAQDLDVLVRPFDHGTTTSVSATVPLTLFGLTGYHSVRGSTARRPALTSIRRRNFCCRPPVEKS